MLKPITDSPKTVNALSLSFSTLCHKFPLKIPLQAEDYQSIMHQSRTHTASGINPVSARHYHRIIVHFPLDQSHYR